MITMTNRRELPGSNPLARYAMAVAAVIAEGDIVCRDADGNAVPGADSAGLEVLGICTRVDADAREVEVRDGIVGLDIATSNGPTRADRGKAVYVTDATKVATTSSNLVCAGVLVDVYDGEAFVDMRPGAAAAAAAGSVAGAAAGATAGAVAGAAEIAADLEDAESTIKAAATTIANTAVAAAGNARLVEAPAAADSAGVKGDIASDGTYLYVCTDTNTWVRGALALANWSE